MQILELHTSCGTSGLQVTDASAGAVIANKSSAACEIDIEGAAGLR